MATQSYVFFVFSVFRLRTVGRGPGPEKLKIIKKIGKLKIECTSRLKAHSSSEFSVDSEFLGCGTQKPFFYRYLCEYVVKTIPT